jgi:drug/metabolite transporter (DMT)-like permease
MFFGGLFILAAACVMGNPAALLKLSASQSLNVLASTGLLLMYVLFWYSSLKLLPVSKASPFLLLAPVISLGIGVFCFGEPAPVLQLAGSALILAGAYCIAKTKDLVVAV